jgi:hypothetical protein
MKLTNLIQFTGKLVMAVKSADDKTEASSTSSASTVVTFTASAAGAATKEFYSKPPQNRLRTEILIE